MNFLSRLMPSNADKAKSRDKSGVALDQFIRLAYGDNSPSPDLIGKIASHLGKSSIDHLADARSVLMFLDRQTYPTQINIQFSSAEVDFAEINGLQCAIDGSDISVSSPAAASGIYEPHIARQIQRYCLQGGVAYDIGANVGFHAMLMASRVSETGQVYAFEPNSENARLILLSAQKNQLKNISLLPLALANKRGWEYFSTHIGSNGGFVDEHKQALQTYGTIVPVMTMDELKLPDPDFIKIDIEGAEYKALIGGVETIKRARPVIICEFSFEMIRRVSGISGGDFIRWVQSLDYRVSIVNRARDKLLPVDSAEELVSTWGSPARIEDLLLVPLEKS